MSTERKTAGSSWVNNLEFKNKVLAMVLVAVILVSALFSSLPLVRAVYTVDHASFPPDLPGDVTCDGVVDGSDLIIVARAFGSWFGSSRWNARADINDDGQVDGSDMLVVTRLFGKLYDTSANPIAYSTSFEFDVPNTGVSGVWYYMLARIYMPPGLPKLCFLYGSSDAGIQNVIIDTLLKCSDQTSGPFNITIGNLTQGYHLLELECLGPAGGGSINFNVQTLAGEAAWLDRFRVCVPDYSSTTQSYTVTAVTNFTFCDRYFIKGFASDCIDNVKFGGGWLYQDWQWEWTSMVEHNGWGDGFNVPTGWLDSIGPRSIQFRYNATNEDTLDFAVVSFTNQTARIARGTPEFWSSVMALPPTGGAISNQTLCAGSHWYGDSGTSERKIIVSQEFYIAQPEYPGGPLLWDAKIRFDISIARLDAVISSETSFAIALNVTYLGGVVKPADSVGIYYVNINAYVPSQALNVVGWEFKDKQGGKSIVDSFFKVITSMTIASAVAYAVYFTDPVGAIVGMAAMGAAATGLLNFAQGTSENPFTSYTYDDTSAYASIDCMGSVGSGQSITEIGFVRVKPMQPTHCGMVRTRVDALLNGAHVFTYIDFPVYV